MPPRGDGDPIATAPARQRSLQHIDRPGLIGIAGKIARDIMAFSVHLALGGSAFFF